MVTQEDIDKTVGQNKASIGKVPTMDLSSINDLVKVILKMDRQSLDYYYSISVQDALNSKLDVECLERLASNGWSLSDDKREILKYIS